MKNVAQMENDMERWLTDRERVSKQLESVRKRKETIEQSTNVQVIISCVGETIKFGHYLKMSRHINLVV